MTRAVVVLVAAAMATASCGGSDDPAAAPTTDGSVTTTAPTETTTETTTDTRVATLPPTSITAPPTTASITTTTSATTTPPTIAPTPPPTTSAEAPSAPSIRELLDAGTVMNLAHAGGDQVAPHSTRFAFAEAVLSGANGLELDVQLTADRILVVQHDDTVDKTTETTGPVIDLTLAEIQALDNAYWFSPECWPCHDRPEDEYVYRGVRAGAAPPPDGYSPDDFRVPTFREIATAFPDLPLDIEIKGSLPQAAEVADVLAREIVELDRTDSVVVVSFDDEVVDVFHELAPDVAVSPGLDRLTQWFLGQAELEPHFEVLQLPPFQGEIEVITPDLVDRIHDEGRVVWVWADDAGTQENREFYSAMLDAGVDGFVAGRPAEMAAAIAG